MKKFACGSKEFGPPFPDSPSGERRGGRVPPTPEHAARQPRALARIDAAGSPTRGLPPPCESPACASRALRGSDFMMQSGQIVC
jgi:hypothetical protein